MGLNKSVSFNIAKLLKEKGFDNESEHYYNEKGERLFDVDFPSLQPTKPHVYYDNPTIAEVVMWIYEKHGIWINVHLEVKIKGLEISNTGKFQANLNKKNHTSIFGKVSDGDIPDGPFRKPVNTQLEAYTEAIKFTLTNLI